MIQLLAWEEKNYIERMKNSDNKKVSETKDTTIKTKTSLMQNDWRDIIDPKLRKIMRLKAKKKRYRDRNKQKIKKYQQDNKEKLCIYMKKYRKERYDKNIQFRISTILRSRLGKSIKDNFKIGSAIKDLGCSIEQLKSYLESKFLLGMSWDNYGVHGWHIDHIKPLSAFDLSDKKQILEACHYSNLQPLWAKDNLSKSDNY
jgi:hypothetical protein